MISWLIAVLSLSQGVQGLMPDMGVAGDSLPQGRKLLGGRELVQKCSGRWGQCGGKQWEGADCCNSGLQCEKKNAWYSQCMPAKNSGSKAARGSRSKPTPIVEETSKTLVQEQPAATKPPASNKRSSTSSGGGEFAVKVCEGSNTFGPSVSEREYKNQGSAVTISSSGSCKWEEYAGGFDGFPSPVIGDGHEKGMDMAIERMFPSLSRSKQNEFLQKMIDMAKPIDLDHPKDVGRADACSDNNRAPKCGERMRNIQKLNKACSQLVTTYC